MKFKAGDQVRYWYKDGKYWCYGEVILIGNLGIKVMFGDPLYDYGYYKAEELELIREDDIPIN